MTDQDSAWLVELGCSPPMWWTGRPKNGYDFSYDANCAMRFARREDAEGAIGHLVKAGQSDGCKATEHIWMAAHSDCVLVREAATEPPTDDACVPAQPRQVMAYRPVVTPVRAAPRQITDDTPAEGPVHRGICPRCRSECGAFGIIPKFCPTCGVPMAAVQDGSITATEPPTDAQTPRVEARRDQPEVWWIALNSQGQIVGGYRTRDLAEENSTYIVGIMPDQNAITSSWAAHVAAHPQEPTP